MLEVNVLAVTGIFGVRVMEHLGHFGGDGISDVNVFLVMGLFGVRVMGVRGQLQGWMGCLGGQHLSGYRGCFRCRVMGLWGSSVGVRGIKAHLRQWGAGNQGSGHSLRAQGCEFLPQNNQLQELPYNELSRLRSLRTLNLHNNLISSEGEG